jgi:hypothetical protein
MAITRRDRRLVELETHTAAEATALQHGSPPLQWTTC